MRNSWRGLEEEGPWDLDQRRYCLFPMLLLLQFRPIWVCESMDLVLEKSLKAFYVKDNENRMPPKTHNLVKLAEKTTIPLNAELKLFLDEVNDFNLEVRYPEYKQEFYKTCTKKFAEEYLNRIKEQYKWIKSLLK